MRCEYSVMENKKVKKNTLNRFTNREIKRRKA